MAYGTNDQVASLARVWTDQGAFTTQTNPADSQVDEWLDQVSATMDIALAMEGFKVPVTNPTAVKALALFVVSVVADLCHAANSSGRFFTTGAIERGVSPMMQIRREIIDWVGSNASGLEAAGAERHSALPDQIGFRGTDERGNDLFPLFQRDAFDPGWQNWDK